MPDLFELCKDKRLTLGVLNESDTIINYTDHDNKTLLHAMCENDPTNIEVISYLLSKTIDINATDNFGHTPLHYLSWNKNININVLNQFVEYKADFNKLDSFNRTGLHIVCLNESVSQEMLAVYLENTKNIDAADKGQGTALHRLCMNKNLVIDLLQPFFEKKCNINALNIRNETPLHVLCYNNKVNKDSLKIFIDKFAKQDLKNDYGETPREVLQRNEHCTRELLELLPELEVVPHVPWIADSEDNHLKVNLNRQDRSKSNKSDNIPLKVVNKKHGREKLIEPKKSQNIWNKIFGSWLKPQEHRHKSLSSQRNKFAFMNEETNCESNNTQSVRRNVSSKSNIQKQIKDKRSIFTRFLAWVRPTPSKETTVFRQDSVFRLMDDEKNDKIYKL